MSNFSKSNFLIGLFFATTLHNPVKATDYIVPGSEIFPYYNQISSENLEGVLQEVLVFDEADGPLQGRVRTQKEKMCLLSWLILREVYSSKGVRVSDWPQTAA
ncbi:MAG: hypothetical protein LBF65_02735 [Holosporales bacterium]|jgi:hypothetical protein|nr:hypothetical protein [Holosporales bacterium]